ncbi:uncharacterized protein LOC119672898 [Teleopsis dalmanni]|uniref:uncharacterized protein LOC119672401 n=1 Tax=Teleopsis dalmanni TaxID=139649 RepID=UPI0018CE5822|nr:uncharacterized protein LOC119672401 [Teleopsis dalmanni]XP_037939993.1 uncharacterized protein LOC119672898 [Teleopsis dalmanni]
MYFKRNTLRILLFVGFVCCSFVTETEAHCSLDDMRRYAMEACEHLFLLDEGARDKRSLKINDHMNLIDDELEYPKYYYDKRHYISRSIYPKGGYLKVGREHFHKLSLANVVPKYKPKKIHDRNHRFKREHSHSYNNIPYCCYNRCEEDFFC